MEDVTQGRINCANITDREWQLLEKLERIGGWYIPSEDEWVNAAGLLALVTVRRGWRWMSENKAVTGWPHIRINNQGKLALSYRKRGEVYTKGQPTNALGLDIMRRQNRAVMNCPDCKGHGKLIVTIPDIEQDVVGFDDMVGRMVYAVCETCKGSGLIQA